RIATPCRFFDRRWTGMAEVTPETQDDGFNHDSDLSEKIHRPARVNLDPMEPLNCPPAKAGAHEHQVAFFA
ncbi:MAG: hypothetical protein ACREEE_01055, partial [Dongiaceae bacterium]